jgi:hypothetical protein
MPRVPYSGLLKSKWISWSELCKKWKIKGADLIDHVRAGLQPYTQAGIELQCPKDYHKYWVLHKKQNHLRVYLRSKETLMTEDWAAEKKKYGDEIELIEQDMKTIRETDVALSSWNYLAFPEPKHEEDSIALTSMLKEEALFRAEDVQNYSSKWQKSKRQTYLQETKEKIKKVAAQILEKEPDIGVSELANRKEIKELAHFKDRKDEMKTATVKKYIREITKGKIPRGRPRKIKTDSAPKK